jgi:peptide/nickel transport system substrate-binding protein
MQRTIALLSVLLLAASALAGCATNNTPNTTPTNGTTSPVVTTPGSTSTLPSNDKNVRAAVAYILDRDQINSVVYSGTVTPAFSVIAAGLSGVTDSYKTLYGSAPNLDKAKAALALSGYSTSKKVSMDLWFNSDGHYGDTEADLATMIKSQLEGSGLFTIKLQSKPWAEYKKDFREGNFALFLIGWFPDYLDPDDYVSPFFTAGGARSFGTFYDNATMQPLIKSEQKETDLAKRATLLAQIQDGVAADNPMIPLFSGQQQVAYKNEITGVTLSPTDVFPYYTIAGSAAGTVTIGTTDTITSLDPANAYEHLSINILQNCEATLLANKADGPDLQPELASALPTISSDGTWYNFTLRDGLKYSDGSAILASDFIYALERNSGKVGNVEGAPAFLIYDSPGVDVKNSTANDAARTLSVHLNQPGVFFNSLVVFPNFAPLPKALYTADKFREPTGATSSLPICSGPYRVTEYRSGESVTLEKNPNYSGFRAAKTDKIVIKIYSTSSSLKSALQNGEVQVAVRTFTPDEWKDLVANGAANGVTTKSIPGPSPLRYLAFNVNYAKK